MSGCEDSVAAVFFKMIPANLNIVSEPSFQADLAYKMFAVEQKTGDSYHGYCNTEAELEAVLLMV